MAGGRSQDHENVADWPLMNWAFLGILSIAAVSVGIFLMIDDAKDWAKFSTPEHPSPVHHWQHGLILFLLGCVGLSMSALMLLWEIFNAESRET